MLTYNGLLQRIFIGFLFFFRVIHFMLFCFISIIICFFVWFLYQEGNISLDRFLCDILFYHHHWYLCVLCFWCASPCKSRLSPFSGAVFPFCTLDTHFYYWVDQSISVLDLQPTTFSWEDSLLSAVLFHTKICSLISPNKIWAQCLF